MPLPAINLNRFDLISLRLYVAVVDGGSLTAGAERFGISVAAASKRIGELEAHVGMRLLTRSKRGASPTPAGQTLLQYAIEIGGNVEQLAVAMDDFKRGAGGHLRLWANPSAFAGFLPDLLTRYAAAHPRVRIDLEDAFSEETIRGLTQGATDLGIIGDNTPHEGFEAVPCDIDELVLVCRADHPIAKHAPVALSEVLALDMVGMSRSTSLMRHVGAAADLLGMPLRIRVQVSNFDAMCRLVASGLGVAVLPRAGAAPHVRSMGLATLRLTGLRTRRQLLLVMRRRDALSAPQRAFVDLAESRLRDAPG